MSDFDDDDDALLLQLARSTQVPRTEAAPDQSSHPDFQSELFRAQGEIYILRAQLESLQASRVAEIAKLNADAQAIEASAQEHVYALKQTVDKLEDEKKFLGNELRSLSSVKRRKGNDNTAWNADTQSLYPRATSDTQLSAQTEAAEQISSAKPLIQWQDDWSQLCHHLWHYTINGADRSSMDFLSKICTETSLDSQKSSHIQANVPFSSCIWNDLITLKHLRLDNLVEQTCESLLSVINELLKLHEKGEPGVLVSVPFIISIIHAAVTFKTSAVTKSLIEKLTKGFCYISRRFVEALQSTEDEAFSGQNVVPYQQRLFENFILVLSFDVLESVSIISTQFENDFSRTLWNSGAIDMNLMQQILPENTERFVSSVQINLVSSYIEMLYTSLQEDHFCKFDEEVNQSIVKSLLKVFIIDIAVKDNFMFYGLNRILGNNHDFHKISSAVPTKPQEIFNKSMVSMPYPIDEENLDARGKFHVAFQHDHHLLTLRVRTVMLLEALVMSNKLELVNSKENIKSIVRIIGYEQNHLTHQPRYELIHMRLTIIAIFVRILFYIMEEHKNINDLIYPETLYEIFVVLMKIAFASDSLSVDAYDLLSKIRSRGITDIGVFNKSCEFRSRELAHSDTYNKSPDNYAGLAGIESEFSNGLEFPYESDTVEIAREILDVCVNHDEAENLYYNMTKES